MAYVSVELTLPLPFATFAPAICRPLGLFLYAPESDESKLKVQAQASTARLGEPSGPVVLEFPTPQATDLRRQLTPRWRVEGLHLRP
jgi:hypothetical protein